MADKKQLPKPYSLVLFKEAQPGKSYVLPHIVPRILRKAILADLASRHGSEVASEKPLRKFGIDRQGSVFMGRPFESFTLYDWGEVEMACEVVEFFLQALKDLEPRTLGKRRYYKLMTGYSCVCLTPTARDTLIKRMQKRLAGANERAEAFLAKVEARLGIQPLPDSVPSLLN